MTTSGSSRCSASQSVVTSFSGWAYSANLRGRVVLDGSHGASLTRRKVRTARLRYRGISETSTPPQAAPHRRPLRRCPKDLRLQALLEYSRKVPPLPDHLAGHPDADGAGRGVPDAVLPGHRGRRRPPGPPVLRRPGRGADDPGLRRHPPGRPRRRRCRRGPGHP